MPDIHSSMPPYKDDEVKMMVATQRPRGNSIISSPASRPCLFELPKDISFLGIQTPSLPSANDVMLKRLEASLEKASQRANDLKQRIQDREDLKTNFPVVYDACRSALVIEMSRTIGQAWLLLEDAKKVDPEVSQQTKNNRVSVALISSLQYLDTLESAMAFSSQDRLEKGLIFVLNSVAAKCKDVEESLNVCVSSWKAPSLAFDFRVGSPAILSKPADAGDPSSLPIDLVVRPIIEYTAEELLQAPNLQQAEAYAVKVIKCKHELREHGSRDGVTGEALVQIHIAPLAETTKKQKEAVWEANTKDVEKIKVMEVRA